MIDVSVDVCGITWHSPLVLASGIWGCCAETLVRLAREGAGAVTAKSCSLEPRRGHPNPTVLDWGHGLINAVGLANPGAAAMVGILRAAKEGLRPLGVPLIASVFGESQASFVRAVEVIAEAEPDYIELNISCPNVEAEFGRPFAMDPLAAAQVTGAVRRAYAGRLLVKLSPNAPDIVAVAKAVAAEGADGLVAVNTLGPGMFIDVRARRPILANKVGGISGEALLPIALRCVYEITQAVDLPVIGVGGVMSGEDALQMVMAGATAVGIGSALRRLGDGAFRRIRAELEALMAEEGLRSLAEARGCAHV